jgi:outer membrane protein assembly factor BamB
MNRRGYVDAAMPKTKDILWQLNLPGSILIDSSPVVDAAHATYICTNFNAIETVGTLSKVTRQGKLDWQFRLGSAAAGNPVLLANGNLVVYEASRNLRCFSPRGQQLWTLFFQEGRRGFGQAVPDGPGGCYFFDDSPMLYALNDNGSYRWRNDLPALASTEPTVSQGRVYVPCNDGRLHYYSAADGQYGGYYYLNDKAIFPAAALSANRLVVPAGQPDKPAYLRSISPRTGARMDYRVQNWITTPVTLSAVQETVFGASLTNIANPDLIEFGQIIALRPDGILNWSLNFNAVPRGQILADNSGRLYFGTSAQGTLGVYCIDPRRDTEWYLPTLGASQVWPLDQGVLGVLSDADDGSCRFQAIGLLPPAPGA